jgi:hypothetical protein
MLAAGGMLLGGLGVQMFGAGQALAQTSLHIRLSLGRTNGSTAGAAQADQQPCGLEGILSQM